MFRMDRAPGGGTYLFLKVFVGVPQPPPHESLFALLTYAPLFLNTKIKLFHRNN